MKTSFLAWHAIFDVLRRAGERAGAHGDWLQIMDWLMNYVAIVTVIAIWLFAM